MKTNSSQPSTNKRFHVRRLRNGLYHVTDTAQHVEYRTSQPDRFLPKQRLRVFSKIHDDIDLDRLARVLIEIVREQDEQS